MIDKSTVKEEEKPILEWFTFKLTRTQAYYLYLGSIIGLLYSIGVLLNNIFISIYVLTAGSLPIPYLIVSILPIMTIIIIGYTIKMINPFLTESLPPEDTSEVNWFGIPIHEKHVPALFFLGLSAFFYLVYMSLMTCINVFFLSRNLLERILVELSNSSHLLIFLVVSVYTMIKMRKVKGNNSERDKWLNFVLSENMQLIIYIASIIGIINLSFMGVLYSPSIFLAFGILLLINNQPSIGDILINIFYLGLLTILVSGFAISIYSFRRIREMQKANNLK